MKTNSVITINGRLYDAVTGLPVQADVEPVVAVSTPAEETQKPAARQVAPASAHQVHQQTQKSTTLHRASLKRPKPMADVTPAKAQTHHRSPVITKFAQHRPAPHHQHHTATVAQPEAPATPIEQSADAPARAHPVVQRAIAKHYAPIHQPQQTEAHHHTTQHGVHHQPHASLQSSQLKEQLIAQSVAAAQPAPEKPSKQKRGFFATKPRLASVLTASLAVLVLGGYLTYFNLPNISMRVAATRAGVAASFPTYKPDGYQFSGPITYAPGEVAVSFKAATSDTTYSVTQKVSTWDSQAVLQNYVLQQSHIYLTYQEHGLTIYSFGNNAAWVNGGILYTIEGNAPLSSVQLLNIASSL